MQIIALKEGPFTIGADKVFVPFEEGDTTTDRAKGSLLVEVQPFCVISQRDILLLDAGLGYCKDGELQIISTLRQHGIEPEQITKVLLSHLHKDHAGGVSRCDRYGDYGRAFPNAVYFLQRREYNYAMDTGFPSFFPDELLFFEHDNNVFWLDDDGGVIDNYIRYEVHGGHSPYHQSFWIEESGEIIFFGGDNAPQLKQMKTRFSAKYDHDGKRAMDLRTAWWQDGKHENWTFLFYHDVKHAVVKAGLPENH
jgi:glyoxylase-like metal-dependent hydrolase (beta-lactamase superfamily II)